jgi:hypothetical protein
VALFFSEGCNAIHSFVIPETPEDEGAETPTVHTQALAHPVLGFAPVPGTPNQIAVTLDAQEDAIVVVEVVADGSVSFPFLTNPLPNPPLPDTYLTPSSPSPLPRSSPPRSLPPSRRRTPPSPPSQPSHCTRTSRSSRAGPGSRRTSSSPARVRTLRA